MILMMVFAMSHSMVWEPVLKCRDEIVDTGERTKDGNRVLRLRRTDFYWSAYEDTDSTASERRDSNVGKEDCSSD